MKQNTKRTPAKGTSRRVVIVPCEKDHVFEQIIYIVRDEWASKHSVTADCILQEAEELIRSEPDSDHDREERTAFPHPMQVILFLIVLLFLIIILFLRFS
jgi:hypothetical protein